MRSLLRRIVAAVIVVLASAAAAHAATFVFTAIPDEDESRLRERFDQVAAYLGKSVGVETKYVPVKSYAAAITAFRNNQVQLAWFGGLSGVQARKLVPGSLAIGQGEEDLAFISYFIANAATGLEPADTLSERVAGRTFTFGEKGSTSGRLMPEFFIRERFGKAPESVFSRVGFSGDHSRTVALVQSGAYEIGALNYLVWDNEMRAGKIDPAKVKIIWKSPQYPDYQWTIRGDADTTFGVGFTTRVTRALLDMSEPEMLAAFPRKKFIPAKNADYEPIERVGKAIGLLD